MLTLMEDESVAALLALPRRKKLGFLLLLGERMFPSLRAFYVSESLDFRVFQEAHDAFWRALERDDALADWPPIREQIIEMLPDTEEFQTPSAVLALGAGCLIKDIGDFIAEGSERSLVNALRHPLDAVHFIADSDHGGMFYTQSAEDYANHHPLVLREKHAEETDVGFLSVLDDATWPAAAIAGLRARAAAHRHLSEPYVQ